ncbi:MAG: hypothetical protein RLZZ15_572 [Verrucomicrobiota bacterium]|jgi:hypothetical protein
MTLDPSPRLSAERLVGLLAGAFLLRAVESAMTSIALLTPTAGELSTRLTAASPLVIAAVVNGILGVGFLRPRLERGFFHVTIVVLVLSACAALFRALLPVFAGSSVKPAVGVSLAVRGVVDLAVVAALLFCVVASMRRLPPELPS